MKRALLYLRLSDAVEDSTSIARQEADLRALAEREGWHVAAVLVDDGISGRKTRANATEALRQLRDREADVLAVWKLDRWTRQGLGAIGALSDTLDASPGSLFVALQDGLRSDQGAWRLVAAVLSEVARTEAENTSTRARSAIRYRKTVTRRYTGGRTIPFGYSSVPAEDGVGRVLVVDPDEAAIVRDVAARLLDGEPVGAVTRSLTAAGVPISGSPYRRALKAGKDPEGLDRGEWVNTTIRYLWTSHLLLGRVALDGDLVRDEAGLPVTVWEPLLDLATAERLRAVLRPGTGRVGERKRAARLLSGLAYCAVCGGKLHVTTSGGKAIYACKASRQGKLCPSPTANAERLEALAAEEYLRHMGDRPETLTVESHSGVAAEAALSEVEAALREASSALLEDDADAPALLTRIAALKERRTTLRETPAEVTSTTTATGRTRREAWAAEESVPARQRMLLDYFDHLTLSPTIAGKRTTDLAARVRFVTEDDDALVLPPDLD